MLTSLKTWSARKLLMFFLQLVAIMQALALMFLMLGLVITLYLSCNNWNFYIVLIWIICICTYLISLGWITQLNKSKIKPTLVEIKLFSYHFQQITIYQGMKHILGGLLHSKHNKTPQVLIKCRRARLMLVTLSSIFSATRCNQTHPQNSKP